MKKFLKKKKKPITNITQQEGLFNEWSSFFVSKFIIDERGQSVLVGMIHDDIRIHCVRGVKNPLTGRPTLIHLELRWSMGYIKFIKQAVDIAHQNVLTNNGGPFGAVIVKDGEVIATGSNEVTTNQDPTAHAEIQAIRAACKALNSHQLTDCEIYTSCEPCPMCIGAIYWARPKVIYYACTKEDAAQIGFDDQFIYDQLNLPRGNRNIKMIQLCPDGYKLPFVTWQQSNGKVEY